ncbi:uncharacterized protein LOC112590492 isoform X1 [Harpegnathos saltator]|uniref:uncharacterized protein LOC112590492 isoform X1 n=1 Tax=Harpegnathos saltator TaxID=610380 RepID=UPI000DBEE860|nr:uncharacterized protein LOC112590492 isoform X1 [Harpegnathos saltator]
MLRSATPSDLKPTYAKNYSHWATQPDTRKSSSTVSIRTVTISSASAIFVFHSIDRERHGRSALLDIWMSSNRYSTILMETVASRSEKCWS